MGRFFFRNKIPVIYFMSLMKQKCLQISVRKSNYQDLATEILVIVNFSFTSSPQ